MREIRAVSRANGLEGGTTDDTGKKSGQEGMQSW